MNKAQVSMVERLLKVVRRVAFALAILAVVIGLGSVYIGSISLEGLLLCFLTFKEVGAMFWLSIFVWVACRWVAIFIRAGQASEQGAGQ